MVRAGRHRGVAAASQPAGRDGGVTLAVQPAGMHGENGRRQVDGNVRSLVLRAWIEPGVSPPLRVRIVEAGPGLSERPVAVTVSVDATCQAVRRWLETLPSQERSGREP